MSTGRDDDGFSAIRATVPIEIRVGQGSDSTIVEDEFPIGGVGPTLRHLAGHKVDGRINNRIPEALMDLAATATFSRLDLSWSVPAWAATTPIDIYMLEFSDNGVPWTHLSKHPVPIKQHRRSHRFRAGKPR